MLVFLILLSLTYFLVQSIVSFSNFNLLAILAGVLVGGAGVAGVEPQLKRRWHSGKTVQINPDTIRLLRNEHPLLEFSLALELFPKVYYWGFQVKSHTRVPKGWYVLACGIKRGEDLLAAFCVMSPSEFNIHPQNHLFTLLHNNTSPNKTSKTKAVSAELLFLQQLERIRWNSGVEMTPSDFRLFVETLQSILP